MSEAAVNTAMSEPDLIARSEGSAGVIHLNRPKTINALTLEMARACDSALDAFEHDSAIALVLLEGAGERGLCAGGDIRGLYESARAKGDLGKVFWREEYIMNARIAAYPKPYVALMHGLVMGGGVGLAVHGSHRIVSETTKVGMPEVGIGFFPDVGGTWLLTRAPGEIGTYFGLTGQTMTGADALYADFADHYVPQDKWPELRAVLTKVRPGTSAGEVDTIIAGFSGTPEPGIGEQHRAEIDRLFAHDRVEDIVAALEKDGSDFAQATLKALREKSPTSMKVTLKLLRTARKSSSLKDTLVQEYRAALTVFESAEFVEGVRAAIIDKDRKPKWSPADITDVTDDIVARYFAPRGADELTFPG